MAVVDCGAGERPSYVGAPSTGAGTGCGWSPSEVEVRHDGDGDEGGGHEVDGGAERGPPAGVGHESGAVLPEVLEAVAGQPGHQKPAGAGDRRRGYDNENR